MYPTNHVIETNEQLLKGQEAFLVQSGKAKRCKQCKICYTSPKCPLCNGEPPNNEFERVCYRCKERKDINEFEMKTNNERRRICNSCMESIKQSRICIVCRKRKEMKRFHGGGYTCSFCKKQHEVRKRGNKRCRTCKEIKDLSEFLPDETKISGFSRDCIDCQFK